MAGITGIDKTVGGVLMNGARCLVGGLGFGRTSSRKEQQHHHVDNNKKKIQDVLLSTSSKVEDDDSSSGDDTTTTTSVDEQEVAVTADIVGRSTSGGGMWAAWKRSGVIDDDHDDDNDIEEDIPGSPVTASPPESPKGFVCDDHDVDDVRKGEDRKGLVFEVGVVAIPHPEKAAKGGEDASFVAEKGMGVFDGVGGWASVGIDAGEYAREVAERTRGGMGGVEDADAVEALEKAVDDTGKTGSSTACVVRVEQGGRKLVGVNLGDSGVMVIRDGRVVMKSREQQHYFNCPFQLGTDSMDAVRSGHIIDWTIRRGDWIVMATDGLWDNVFTKEVLDAVARGRDWATGRDIEDADAEWSVDRVAQELAKRALEVGLDTSAISPFSVNAHDAGALFVGGKLDDVTVLVGRATEEDEDFSVDLYGHVVTRAMMNERITGSGAQGRRRSDDGVARRLDEELLSAESIDDIRLN